MSVADNFDYSIPTLNRNQTMYLQTITPQDAKIHPFKKLDTQRDWSANLYNLDIESSSPRRFGIFTNKVDFINKVDDIERTNSKILHYPLNKPEYNLSNADIEKSSPNMGNLRTNRCTNPLEPKYTLPKVEEYPPEIPKFIRDQIDIKDIQGTHPQKYFQWGTRETFPLDNHGIEGSKTKQKYIRQNVGNSKYHYLDYSDLTKEIFKTGRHTNPLDPIYNFKNKNGEPFEYGVIEKSKPQTIYPYTHPVPFGLKTDDIIGAQVGSKNKINAFTGRNYEMTTNDIKGCSVGSLKKGISTMRCTNPIYPKYQYLGNEELKQSENQKKKMHRAQSVGINKNIGNVNKFNKKPSIHSNEEQKNPVNDNINNNNINDNNNINNDNNNNENINNENINNDGNFDERNFARTQYDNEGFGNGFFNDKVDFNPDKYIKPKPFYGFIHDKYVNPSDNAENLAKIEKEKTEKKIQDTKTLTGTNFYKPNVSQYSGVNLNNNFQNTKFNATNNQPGITNNSLMNTTNLNNALNRTNSSMMSRTATNSFGLSKGKLSYAQQLDKFMYTNNLKYIEPPQPIQPQPPVVEEIPVEVEDKGIKNTSDIKKGGKK